VLSSIKQKRTTPDTIVTACYRGVKMNQRESGFRSID